MTTRHLDVHHSFYIKTSRKYIASFTHVIRSQNHLSKRIMASLLGTLFINFWITVVIPSVLNFSPEIKTARNNRKKNIFNTWIWYKTKQTNHSLITHVNYYVIQQVSTAMLNIYFLLRFLFETSKPASIHRIRRPMFVDVSVHCTSAHERSFSK